jgi:hypothetical protein
MTARIAIARISGGEEAVCVTRAYVIRLVVSDDGEEEDRNERTIAGSTDTQSSGGHEARMLTVCVHVMR